MRWKLSFSGVELASGAALGCGCGCGLDAGGGASGGRATGACPGCGVVDWVATGDVGRGKGRVRGGGVLGDASGSGASAFCCGCGAGLLGMTLKMLGRFFFMAGTPEQREGKRRDVQGVLVVVHVLGP
jgi:hypothetical protein